MPDFTPCWPGFESSLHLESSERRALLRNRSVPSRRASLHLGPRYRATVAPCGRKYKPAFARLHVSSERENLLSAGSTTCKSQEEPGDVQQKCYGRPSVRYGAASVAGSRCAVPA